MSRRAYVNLAIFESLIQVLVDGFIGDLADEGEIRDSDLLLLCRFEGRLSDLRLSARGSWLCGSGILLSSGTFGYGLRDTVSELAQRDDAAGNRSP